MNLRIVAGRVRGDGSIDRGEGFSVTRKHEGSYSIVFDPPFAGRPVVVASIDDARRPAGFVRVVHFRLVDRFDVVTLSDFDPEHGSGTCGDRGFSFIAVGRRE
ncbi:MAG: hypothetical protein ACYSU0_18530 [Planctomycetota bacterium]|jgi:hypothetical protein